MKQSNWIRFLFKDTPLGAMVVVMILAFALLRPQVGSHNSPRLAQCANNLKQLAIGLLEYESAQGCFPAVGVKGKGRQPSMSWRVAILPSLGRKDLFDQYDPKEPWDGPRNRKIAASMPDVFHCPSAANRTSEQTNYVMIAGPGSVGGLDDKSRGPDYISSHAGASTTLLLIEVPGEGVHWMDPCDLTIDEIIKRVTSHALGPHSGILVASFCDGHSEFIPSDIAPETLRALANPNGKRPVHGRY